MLAVIAAAAVSVEAMSIGPQADSLRKTLPNGARLIARRIPGSPAFSAQTFFRAGPAYETEQTNGISHLLEHMAFRGSPGGLDSRVETVGAFLNGTTYREAVRYFCDGPNPAWRDGAEAVAQLVLPPRFDSAQLGNELKVIEEELAFLDTDPGDVMNRALWRAAFGSHPRSLPPMGSAAAARRASLGSLRRFHAEHCIGANLVAVLVGDIDPAEGLRLLERLYGGLPSGTSARAGAAPELKPGRQEERSPFNAEFVGFGFAAPGFDKFTGYVAWELLTQAMMAKLDRLGEGTSADVYFGPSATGSLLTVVVRGSPDRDGLESAAAVVFRDLAQRGLTREELFEAKRRLRKLYERRLRSASDTGFLLGAHLLFGNREGVNEVFDAVNEAQAADVNRAAANLALERGVAIVWRRR